MPPPSIDRAAWGAFVSSLVQQETGGNVAAFAALIGVDRKTVGRWIRGESAVSEDNVRRITRALGLPIGETLVKIGYYQPGDLSTEPVEQTGARGEDPAIANVMAAEWARLSTRRRIAEHLRKRAREQEEQALQERIAEGERLLELMEEPRGKKAAG